MKNALKTWRRLSISQKLGVISLGLAGVFVPAATIALTTQTYINNAVEAYQPTISNYYKAPAGTDSKIQARRTAVDKLYDTSSLAPNLDQISLESQEVITRSKVSRECKVGGCAGQLCLNASDEDIYSTCEWREEYACYKNAVCELQSNGLCGWTQTDELASCLNKSTNLPNLSPTHAAESEPPSAYPTPTDCSTQVVDGDIQSTCDQKPACTLQCASNQVLTQNCTCEPIEDNARCNQICEPDDICPVGAECIWEGKCPSDCELSNQPPSNISTKSKTQTACESDPQGTWRQFSNTCGDSCQLITDPLTACGEEPAPACDCGPNSCWNGQECVANHTLRADILDQYGFHRATFRDFRDLVKHLFSFFKR